MAISVVCRKCNRRYSLPDSALGSTRTCPSCGDPLYVPDAPALDRADREPEAGSPQRASNYAPLIPNLPKREFQDLVDMTAMVDIVFFLLIFFLVSSLCDLQATLPAPKPEPTLGKVGRKSAAAEPQAEESLAVSIDQDDVVWFEGDTVVSDQDLIVRLRNAREASGFGKLRIAGHPQATHGKIVMVMDAAVSAGMTEVQLAVDELIE